MSNPTKNTSPRTLNAQHKISDPHERACKFRSSNTELKEQGSERLTVTTRQTGRSETKVFIAYAAWVTPSLVTWETEAAAARVQPMNTRGGGLPL